jgi:hypothetical protein
MPLVVWISPYDEAIGKMRIRAIAVSTLFIIGDATIAES